MELLAGCGCASEPKWGAFLLRRSGWQPRMRCWARSTWSKPWTRWWMTSRMASWHWKRTVERPLCALRLLPLRVPKDEEPTWIWTSCWMTRRLQSEHAKFVDWSCRMTSRSQCERPCPQAAAALLPAWLWYEDSNRQNVRTSWRRTMTCLLS